METRRRRKESPHRAGEGELPEPELASAPDRGLDAQPVPAPDRGLDELAVGGWKRRRSHQKTCTRREPWAPMVERRGRSCGDAATAK